MTRGPRLEGNANYDEIVYTICGRVTVFAGGQASVSKNVGRYAYSEKNGNYFRRPIVPESSRCQTNRFVAKSACAAQDDSSVTTASSDPE